MHMEQDCTLMMLALSGCICECTATQAVKCGVAWSSPSSLASVSLRFLSTCTILLFHIVVLFSLLSYCISSSNSFPVAIFHMFSLYSHGILEIENSSLKLKTVWELHDLEIHQKKLGPDYHRLKTMVKRSDTSNGNYEKCRGKESSDKTALENVFLKTVHNRKPKASVPNETIAVFVTISAKNIPPNTENSMQRG